jgi:hypothetical protein
MLNEFHEGIILHMFADCGKVGGALGAVLHYWSLETFIRKLSKPPFVLDMIFYPSR